MLQIYCPCGHLLGEFEAADDNGSIIMKCPKCSRRVEIFNAAIMEVAENPDDYEPNDRITAEAYE